MSHLSSLFADEDPPWGGVIAKRGNAGGSTAPRWADTDLREGLCGRRARGRRRASVWTDRRQDSVSVPRCPAAHLASCCPAGGSPQKEWRVHFFRGKCAWNYRERVCRNHSLRFTQRRLFGNFVSIFKYKSDFLKWWNSRMNLTGALQ